MSQHSAPSSQPPPVQPIAGGLPARGGGVAADGATVEKLLAWGELRARLEQIIEAASTVGGTGEIHPDISHNVRFSNQLGLKNRPQGAEKQRVWVGGVMQPNSYCI